MKIAFSGAQSSGKTTLVEALRTDAKFKDFQFFTSITRDIEAKGFKINEEGNDATQIEIMNEHVRRLATDKDGIYDRCTLDGVVYTDYLYQQGKVDRETLATAVDMFQATIKKYDYIFYTDANIALGNDGTRSTSIAFKNAIVDAFDFYINKFEIPVISLRGTVEERLKTIQGVLHEYHGRHISSSR